MPFGCCWTGRFHFRVAVLTVKFEFQYSYINSKVFRRYLSIAKDLRVETRAPGAFLRLDGLRLSGPNGVSYRQPR